MMARASELSSLRGKKPKILEGANLHLNILEFLHGRVLSSLSRDVLPCIPGDPIVLESQN
jgi:hypothetical protein